MMSSNFRKSDRKTGGSFGFNKRFSSPTLFLISRRSHFLIIIMRYARDVTMLREKGRGRMFLYVCAYLEIRR